MTRDKHVLVKWPSPSRPLAIPRSRINHHSRQSSTIGLLFAIPNFRWKQCDVHTYGGDKSFAVFYHKKPLSANCQQETIMLFPDLLGIY